MNELAQILKILLTQKSPFIILCSSAAILLLPQPAVKALCLTQLANDHRSLLSLAMLFSLFGTLHKPLVIGLRLVYQLIKSRNRESEQMSKLRTLAEDEREILAAIHQARLGQKTLDSGNQAVCSLCHKGILINTGYAPLGEKATLRGYAIAPWALAYLRAHADFLKL